MGGRFLVGLIAAGLALAACGGGDSAETTTSSVTAATPTTTTTTTPTTTTTTTPTTTTTTTPTSEYVLFDGSAHGFTIALPPRWVPLDLTKGDAEAILEAVEGVLDPEAVELVRGSQVAGGGFALYAFDVTGDPNVNVIAGPRGPLDSLENLEELAPRVLAELVGATVLSIDRVEIDGTEALQLIYELILPGVPLIEGHQYYMVTENTVYVITFSSLDPDADREVFAAVMDTFMPIADFGGGLAFTYGDDPLLDALYDECAAGSGSACDDLFFGSPSGSEYESFGGTCGERFPEETSFDCEGNMAPSPQDLYVGVWRTANGAFLIHGEDGTWSQGDTLESAEANPFTWGTNTFDGTTVTGFTNEESPVCPGVTTVFEISFSEEGNVVTLTPIDDPCLNLEGSDFSQLTRYAP